MIIPARRNSKGLPFKNRHLLQHTLGLVPVGTRLAVTTDDEEIERRCIEQGVCVLRRDPILADDRASIRPVMQDAVDRLGIPQDELVVMLYLTYPERTWSDVLDAISFMRDNSARSLLCRKEVTQHPFLMMLADGPHGRQVIEHDLYRRQDYPEAFEISHYVCAFLAGELQSLNLNMYNQDTVFYPISAPIDVDRPEDLDLFLSSGE